MTEPFKCAVCGAAAEDVAPTMRFTDTESGEDRCGWCRGVQMPLNEWLIMNAGSAEAEACQAIVGDMLVAERERCAKIADEYARRAWAAQPSGQEAAVAAEHIAKAIRG